MIKIAFNIPRRNFYRVLAAPIYEALRRGWRVTCLHGNEERNSQADLPLPSFSAFPDFPPAILNYQGTDEFVSLVRSGSFDVVVDSDMIPISLIDAFDGLRYTPLKVLLDGITHPRLQFGGKFARFDLFITPSQWHIDCTINTMTRNHASVFAEAEQDLSWVERKAIDRWKLRYVYRWTEEDANYYAENSVVVGTPSLDDIKKIDQAEVRERWGIPLEVPVVGLLPSPWDMPLGYLWGDLNMVKNSIGLLRTAIRHRQLLQLPYLSRAPKDKDLVKAISHFCVNNGALLVAKLRKFRSAQKHLIDRADFVLGEDGFFPHTALELFAISDVCFGFCSTGAFECVAAGTPYVDINIPLFPKNDLIKLRSPSAEVTLPWRGVVREISAETAINNLPNMKIDDFRLDQKGRTEYLKHFTSGIKESSSSLMMDAIEDKLRGA